MEESEEYMAKMISRKNQNEVYKNLIEIIKVLVKVEGDEATDAIIGAFDIAAIVGGKEMLEAMGGYDSRRKVSKSCREEIASFLSRMIDATDNVSDVISDCMWK